MSCIQYTNTIIRMQEQKGSHDEHFTNHNQQKMEKERTETVKIPPVTAENEIIGPLGKVVIKLYCTGT